MSPPSTDRFRTRLVSLLVGSVSAVGGLTACNGDGDGTATDPDPGTTTTTTTTATTTASASDPAEPSTAATTVSSSASGSAQPEPRTVPAYFVARTPQGLRLFREFRRVVGDPLNEAAALVVSGDALDPDYRTLWPAGASFDAVRHNGGRLVVELTDDTLTRRPSGMTARQARLAVQQLVYTLQGVVQRRAALTATLDRQPVPLLGVPTTDGVRNGPQLQVLGLVNVTTPEQGAMVSGSIVASGVASSFEATVPWQLRRGDRVVRRGFATAEGWMDRLYPWRTRVRVAGLAPGRYEFVAMTDDPSGGEGFGPTEDTKTITIR